MKLADPTAAIDTVAVASAIDARIKKIERREWWLWATAILVTLLLTLGIVSFVVPVLHLPGVSPGQMSTAIRSLVALVLLFDLYTIYQQLQIYRIRRRLRDREVLFRIITENAADMIAVIDAQGQRLYNSPSYEKILGYSAEELRTTSSIEQIHPDDRAEVQEAAKIALEGGPGRRIEYRMRHKDGAWRFLESTASPVRDAQGKVEKLVILNRDVTERKRLEEQFRQAQKMEAVGRLSGGIAHDFNNLLGVIIGYSEIVQESLEETHPLRSSVDEILNAGRRAASLTRQLLAFSRQQVLEPKVLDLNSVISDIEKMLHRMIGEDVALSTSLAADLGRVKADQGQIEQIIMNMAVNARDAMPNGGRLILETSNTEIDESFARQYPYPIVTGPYIRLTVTDTGTGMDSATTAHIFEPFFTTKDKGKGTGLGLATVYGIIKQSGGYIHVYSEVGLGTTFKVYLPRVDEAIPQKTPTPTARSVGGAETVLLVEDEGSLRVLTRNLLQLSGYRVLEAKDGEEAVEIAHKHTGGIDLLLTDVVMPGISGRVLADQLTGERPEIKVVYMSGYTGQMVGAHVLAPGSIFIQKPFTRDNLARKVRDALDGRASSASE